MTRMIAHERIRNITAPSRFTVEKFPVHSARASSMLSRVWRFFYRAVNFGRRDA